MAERDIRVDRKRIDALMELRGIDAHQLAAKMDMHYNGVQKIRKEESTSLAGLKKLCDALDCHPFDVLVAEGYPQPFSVALASR